MELDLLRIRGSLGEGGSQVKQRMSERDLHQVPQVDVPWMRKKVLQWETGEGRKVEESFGRKKEKRDSQGKDPRTFDETAKVRTEGPLKKTAREGDPRTLKEPVERWRA